MDKLCPGAPAHERRQNSHQDGNSADQRRVNACKTGDKLFRFSLVFLCILDQLQNAADTGLAKGFGYFDL